MNGELDLEVSPDFAKAPILLIRAKAVFTVENASASWTVAYPKRCAGRVPLFGDLDPSEFERLYRELGPDACSRSVAEEVSAALPADCPIDKASVQHAPPEVAPDGRLLFRLSCDATVPTVRKIDASASAFVLELFSSPLEPLLGPLFSAGVLDGPGTGVHGLEALDRETLFAQLSGTAEGRRAHPELSAWVQNLDILRTSAPGASAKAPSL